MNRDESTGSDHILTIKAFRLTTPRLSRTRVVMPLTPLNTGISNDSYMQSLNRAIKGNLAIRTVCDDDSTLESSFGFVPFALSEQLQVGKKSESVLLGQLLSLYLCITNDGTQASQNAQNVNIRVEIRTPSQSHVLCDTTAQSTGALSSQLNNSDGASRHMYSECPNRPVSGIESNGGSFGFILKHELKEIGPHDVIFSVQYAVGLQSRGLRRVFRYQAVNPLNVKTKSHNAPDGSSLLEVQLQNMSGTTLHLESVLFTANDVFDMKDLSLNGSVFALNGDSNDVHTFSAGDTRQYLFHLKPRDSKDLNHRKATTLGKLDLEWRTASGGRGHLQTSQLARRLPSNDPIRIHLIAVSSIALIEQPFSVICLVEINDSLCDPRNLHSSLSLYNSANSANQNIAPVPLDSCSKTAETAWLLQSMKTELKYMLMRGKNDIYLSQFKPTNSITDKNRDVLANSFISLAYLEWIPLVSGIQKFPPVRLLETTSGVLFKQFNNWGHVLVRDKSPTSYSEQAQQLKNESQRISNLFEQLKRQFSL